MLSLISVTANTSSILADHFVIGQHEYPQLTLGGHYWYASYRTAIEYLEYGSLAWGLEPASSEMGSEAGSRRVMKHPTILEAAARANTCQANANGTCHEAKEGCAVTGDNAV